MMTSSTVREGAPPRDSDSSNDGDEGIDASSGFLDTSEMGKNAQKKQQEEVVDRLKEQLMKQDNTQAVRLLRIVVLVFLFATAAVVSLGLYFYSSNNEKEDFETAFDIHANNILESFGTAVERKLVAFGTLSNAITNFALHGKGSEGFPFVTVPNFEVLAADFRTQSDSTAVHWCPMVTDEKRDAWEAFSLKNRFHIDEAFVKDLELRGIQDKIFEGLLQEEEEQQEGAEEGGQERNLQLSQEEERFQESVAISDYNLTMVNDDNETVVISIVGNMLPDASMYRPKIWSESMAGLPVPLNSGPFFPRWQRSPVDGLRQFVLNSDLLQAPFVGGRFTYLLEDPKVLVTPQFIFPEDHPFYKGLSISQYRHQNPEFYIGDPVSMMVYPVFDEFYDPTKPVEHQREHLAGLLQTNLFWRLYFSDVLPPDVKGVICVLENSFNQTFSYRIDGPNAQFLGEVDPVDLYKNYEDMGITLEDTTAYIKSHARPETRSYTTVPLHDTFGVYKLRVYPSEDTENEFTSNQPLLFTVAVAAVFFFTVLVFVLFDFLVERRQRIVMNRALQSGALVSSLFPEQVQNRLYDEHGAGKKKSKKLEEANPWKVRNSTNSDGNDNEGDDDGQIADVYPSTTIFFADLAGFTSWSSKRQPKDVFKLLETLYGAFDAIAEKRRVYKIETIGDCYVAITGCPNAQDDHAAIMCKFARDCMNKMGHLTHSLADTLGQDTTELGFRVGLHSGPVTAGVLRGQKARFQLFGDSVNTAARMESNGVKGKIQVSQATADELIAHGKESWLTAREEKVLAKGKGEMQTYFVQVTSSPGTYKSRMSSYESDGEEEEEYEDEAPTMPGLTNVVAC